MRKHLPPWEPFIGLILPQFSNYRILDRIDSGTNGHVFRAHSEKIEGELAFKFVPTANLPHDPELRETYLADVKIQNILHSSCVVPCIDVIPWKDPSTNGRFIVFVYPYIVGESLDRYIRRHRTEIDIHFIESLLGTLFRLFFELQEREMAHGDLHAGNILVSRSQYSLDTGIVFKVIDFGMSKVVALEDKSDYLYLAEILHRLLRCINYQELTSRDRYVHQALTNDFLRRHLIETDLLADPLARNPARLFEKLSNLDVRFVELNRDRSELPILSPFDYPSCEQMGNSHILLKTLYSDRLLGLSQIQARTNLVLTGPRGCGKTTVCRALSLEYRIMAAIDDPARVHFIGVYYRCDDLYFSFPRFEASKRKAAVDIPMHYVVVSLISETLQFLSRWCRRHFIDEYVRKERGIVQKISEILGLTVIPAPGSDQMLSLISKLAKERRRAARKHRFCNVPSEPIEGYVGPEALFDFCSILRSELSFLESRPLIYFIDDYSTPKITGALQRNLNRLFMHRTADVFFKLSTESPISFERGDIDGKEYVEEREYEVLNLGLRYLKSDRSQVEAFLRDLFARRFSAVDSFKCGSLDELIGSYQRNENETARLFRKGQNKNTFWGVETVSAMCSGDIHYIIRLVGRMVDDVGGIEYINSIKVVPRISPARQSRSVRSAAGDFVESVRNMPRRGDKLANIVSAFGNVASSYLRYRNSRNASGRPPHQASRIEPYDPLNLGEEALELLNDLVRFSILIIDPRGKSRRGHIVPRFYLRRYLLPHFNLTFSRRDSLELENREIELLLLNPEGFERVKRVRVSSAEEMGAEESLQGELFG